MTEPAPPSSSRDNGNPHIAILGAGPIGLEAAAMAHEMQMSFTVYERGRVGENVLDWGHVRLFTPFGMNVSDRGRQLLRSHALPAGDERLSGAEIVDRYYRPLADSSVLRSRIREGTTVLGVSRRHFRKLEGVGSPLRAENSFSLLVRSEGQQRFERADIVLDCTGVYGKSCWSGPGGLPIPGEREILTPLNYRIPDLNGAERYRCAGKTTLVIGSGYSAATAVVALGELHRTDPGTRTIWMTRTDRDPPVSQIPDDTLTERRQLTASANELAKTGQGGAEWRAGVQPVAIRRDDRRYVVSLAATAEEPAASKETIAVDEILIFTGYRPDLRMTSELQIHRCYATGGPMKLAAALMKNISEDCLAQPTPTAEVLTTTEPNFFVLGAKSYGRNSHFLLRTGLEQVEQVFSLLNQETEAKSATVSSENPA